MIATKHLVKIALASLLVMPMGVALADASKYPDKTVRLVVPFPPGQATDLNARLLADKLSKKWGQPVIVVNRGGGLGIPGMLEGRDAAPDGYTITFGSSSTTVVNEVLYPEKLPYRLTDFIPVAPVFQQDWLLVAPEASPFNSLKDVVNAAKKEPGKLTWGYGATALELAAFMLSSDLGIKMTGVGYKGSAATVTDLAGGHIGLAIETMAATLPQLKSNRIKALANLSSKRSTLLPNVPTVSEQGVPGFHAGGWAGLFVPKGTPQDIVLKISQDVQSILKEPEVQNLIQAQGSTADTRNQQEFAKFVDTELAKWQKLAKETKVSVGK